MPSENTTASLKGFRKQEASLPARQVSDQPKARDAVARTDADDEAEEEDPRD